MLVWQSESRNEWATAINGALGIGGPPARPAGEAGPFSLADPPVTRRILADAGFIEVGFTDVHEPVFYGRDTEAAYDAVTSLWQTERLLADLDAETAGRTIREVRATLAAHDSGHGVLFDSRAWIVTATQGP